MEKHAQVNFSKANNTPQGHVTLFGEVLYLTYTAQSGNFFIAEKIAENFTDGRILCVRLWRAQEKDDYCILYVRLYIEINERLLSLKLNDNIYNIAGLMGDIYQYLGYIYQLVIFRIMYNYVQCM